MTTMNYLFVTACSENVDNFAEGFRFETVQNTTGVGIEAERPTENQNYPLFERWPKTLFFIQILFSSTKLWIVDFGVKISQKLPIHAEKSRVGVVYGLVVSLDRKYFFKDAANGNVTGNDMRDREMNPIFFF